MSGGLSCSGWGDGNAERGTRKSEQAFQFRVPTSAFRVSPLVYRPHARPPSYRGPAAARRPDRDHARLGDDHALVGEDRVRDAARRHRIPAGRALEERRDRKSTRLNSSHSSTSYAVVCLKRKKSKPTLNFKCLINGIIGSFKC